MRGAGQHEHSNLVQQHSTMRGTGPSPAMLLLCIYECCVVQHLLHTAWYWEPWQNSYISIGLERSSLKEGRLIKWHRQQLMPAFHFIDNRLCVLLLSCIEALLASDRNTYRSKKLDMKQWPFQQPSCFPVTIKRGSGPLPVLLLFCDEVWLAYFTNICTKSLVGMHRMHRTWTNNSLKASRWNAGHIDNMLLKCSRAFNPRNNLQWLELGLHLFCCSVILMCGLHTPCNVVPAWAKYIGQDIAKKVQFSTFK